MDELTRAWRRGDFVTAYARSRTALPVAAGEHSYRTSPAPLDDARRWHEHGQLCWYMAHLEEARRAFQQALALRTAMLGPDDLDTLDTAQRIAAVVSYDETTAREDATTRFRAVIDALERLPGDLRIPVAIARRNLAAHLRDGGELQLARAELDPALAELRALLPPEHPDHVDALKVHALQCHLEGEHHDALVLAEQAIQLGKRCWDIEHPFVAAAELTAARAETELARNDRARSRLANVVRIWRASYGPHPLVALALQHHVHNELHGGGELDDVERIAREAITIYGGFYRGDFLVHVQLTLVDVLVADDRHDEATALANELLDRATTDARVAICRRMSDALFKVQDLTAGLAWLERARSLGTGAERAELDELVESWRSHIAEEMPD